MALTRDTRSPDALPPDPFQAFFRDCRCCPRQCRVNRLAGETGFCRTGPGYAVGAVCLHRGEEPVISGEHGICNVFFTRCSLQCSFCQNHQISRNQGPDIEHRLTLDQLLGRIEPLLDQGAHALGLVSPSHVIPQVVTLIRALSEKGRNPVIVYNTHAYDRPDMLRRLSSLIPVYLPDLKYMDEKLARDLSQVPDYPEKAGAAIREMVRQKGLRLEVDRRGRIRSGVIVRHLVLPGQVENSRRVLRFLAEEISPDIFLSLMAQYTPTSPVMDTPPLNRGVTRAEYDEVLDEMDFLGFENGWVQDLDSQDNYSPDFARSHPFEP